MAKQLKYTDDAARSIKAGVDKLGVTDGENIGCLILAQALYEPLREIAKNAGQDGQTVLNKVLAKRWPAWGYDAEEDRYCDMFEAGIVDPAKVTRSAVENAASIAGLLLTTEVLITNIPK